MAILEVKNLKKTFKKIPVIKGINFAMQEGEILGILGPNGAGKTTTLQMILGILTPTSGSIKIFNQDLATHKSQILEYMSFSSAYTDLPWRLTIEENLKWTSYLYDITDRQKRLARIKEIFRLEPLWKMQMSSLSAGQKTRVNLARSMVNFPKLLLLDEPTASLDPEVALYLREFFADQRKKFNTTIILTSHNMAEVEELCDRVIIFKDGLIIGDDTPSHLAKKIESSHLRLRVIENSGYLDTIIISHGLESTKNKSNYVITIKEQSIPSFLNEITTKEIRYSEISIDKPTLEDYFLKIAGGSAHEAL